MHTAQECKVYIRPVRDVLDLIGGKWKLPVLIALSFGPKRFNELERVIEGINPRMLSKELKDLEVNQLIARKEHPTVPVTVEYALTDYGKSLDQVIDSMRKWGLQHREKVFEKHE